MNIQMHGFLSYNELIEKVISAYIKEFGERKYNNIIEKVMSSKKVARLLYLSEQKQMAPNGTEIFLCLNGIPYFIFSRGQTTAVGGLILLQKWNLEVNSKFNMLSESGLKKVAVSILENSKDMFF